MSQKKINRTTRVEAVIKNIETVLEKSRNLLMEEDIKLLEKSLKDLKSINNKTFGVSDIVAISRVVVDLLRLFDIDNLF
ncbi:MULTISPECIES: hypothetical protein [Elizabethkingia]|uniref:hypothetical protein n=1 Tax=Elizabethkingia TaxID=308865 RepID=UPI0021A83B94|nr:hypothetical protein [Elizabethkingia anophelis]MCT4059592.1 hypothetical protein [Elizabethkingia anophelis]MCT4070201.1 hypothetical protein [Elizabethkingia anophelis]MCT4320642.1 hypothetical protein [Elizabethkingia anophelis]